MICKAKDGSNILRQQPGYLGHWHTMVLLGFGEFVLGFLVFSILSPRHDTGRTLRTISLGVVIHVIGSRRFLYDILPHACWAVFSFYQRRRSSI